MEESHIPPGLIQNPTDRTRRYDMFDNANTDSAAELEHKVWEDACAWKCQYAPANIPPGISSESAEGHNADLLGE